MNYDEYSKEIDDELFSLEVFLRRLQGPRITLELLSDEEVSELEERLNNIRSLSKLEAFLVNE